MFDSLYRTVVFIGLALLAPVYLCGQWEWEPGRGDRQWIGYHGEEVGEIANRLSVEMGRMTGMEWPLREERGLSGPGVVLRLAEESDFGELFSLDPRAQDNYRIIAGERGVELLGASLLALEFAMWDFLGELGYRHYFPGPTWEYVPQLERIGLSVNRSESPDFIQRRYGVGHGVWQYNREKQADWRVKNRFESNFTVPSSHVYQAIVRQNREIFDEHPEYLALVNGERRGTKLCISNPGLREVVRNWAEAQLRANPEQIGISMEPSDGGGHCECEDCAALGSITDRVVLLANHVAHHINTLDIGDRYVGMLAYHQHSPPPSVPIHPNVVVRVATNFIRGGYTHEDLLEDWGARGATLGVTDFWSVFVWDASMPARQKGSDIATLRREIPRYRRQGAQYFNTSLSDNFGATGLGAWLGARMLWDVSEADRIEDHFAEFISKMFPGAEEPLTGFFRLIYRWDEEDDRPLIRSDMVARMYVFLQEALAANPPPEVRERILELVQYTRYADLYDRYDALSGGQREAMAREVIRHAYRMRETSLVHTRPILNHMARRDRNIDLPAWQEVVEGVEPFTEAEVLGFIEDGLAFHEVVEMPFRVVHFSHNLVPPEWELPEVTEFTPRFPSTPPPQRINLWLEEGVPQEVEITTGTIEHYRHLAGPVSFDLTSTGAAIQEPVQVVEGIEPDGGTYTFELESPYPGHHELELRTPTNRGILKPGEGVQYWTMETSMEFRNRYPGVHHLYFYVPKGTTQVGGFATTERGSIQDSRGRTVYQFDQSPVPGYFSVDVPEGEDGKYWTLRGISGQRALLTVPPFVATHPSRLLIPAEVVRRDRDSR